jgi:hypothetical protein
MANSTMADEVRQRQDKDGMLRRALERIIQLYTDKSHFVYELLQNAEDAGASQIKFKQYQDRLEVLHDGHPFSLANLQGLCDIGKSDKIGDLNQIGEFGVGFKSVFGICETVRLYSHPRAGQEKEYRRFAVEVRDFTNPVDIQDEEIDPGYTTRFVFPYSVGYTFSGFQTVEKLNEVLSNRLRHLGITTLLFMKNLQAIDYEIHLPGMTTSGAYMLDKHQINDHCALVSAIGETNKSQEEKKGKKGQEEQIQYLVFSRPVADIQMGRTIDIAFTVSVNENGEYNFRRSKYPYISVYFPTETESKLNFIVQGPYRTTPNRGSVPADDKDNISLAKQTAKLMQDSVRELRDAGKLNISLLNILPFDEEAFESSPLFECMYETTRNMMRNERFLICRDGSYAAPRWVKIARGDKFAEVFSDDLISELLHDGKQYHWLPTFLTETNKQYKGLYDFLTNELEIEVMRPENMRNYFNQNPEFLRKRSDDWLVEMYSMYENVGAAFSKQKGGSNMLTARFIKTSTGDFVAPYRKSDSKEAYSYGYLYNGYENATYLPNVFLPTKNSSQMEDIPFVDDAIYHRCEHFFKEILSLQKPNEYEFFIRDFKKRYSSGFNFTDQQHITDVKHLLKYRSNEDYQDEVDNLIEQYLVLRCNKNGKRVYINPHKEKVLFAVTDDGMSLEYYFQNIATYAFIDADFYEQDDIDADKLRLLGVTDDISVGRGRTNGEYYTGNPGRQPEWNTYGGFLWKLSLLNLDDVLEYISKHPGRPDSMAKSSFIFKFLQKNEAHLMGTVYVGGSTPNLNNAFSDIVQTLRYDKKSYRYYGSEWNGKWLYTESRDLVSQMEISKRDLNEQLYGEVRYDSSLYDILGFSKNEADKLEEAAKDYDRIPEEKRDQYFEIEFQRRFGIPVSEGEEILEGKTPSKGTKTPIVEEGFEFPSSKVKNWDSLRKHVAEVLCFASPVKYEYKVRSIRVSKPASEVQAYLKNMYKIDGKYKYACQMCHDAFSNVEMCQIANNPELELDAMNLCLCPSCAAEYKKMRADQDELDYFLESIMELEDNEINSEDPVKIDFDGESIWFTQSHIAEIKELMELQEEADNYHGPVDRASEPKPEPGNESHHENAGDSGQTKPDADEEVIKSGTDVYKEYIGKRIFHKGYKAYGTVTSCNGKYIKVRFENGKDRGRDLAGLEKAFSLEVLLDKKLLQLV